MNIHLDEESHRYLTDQGRMIPGVGEIVKACGGMSDFGFDEVSAAFGKAVHRATELYDQGVVEEWPDGGLIEEYLQGYRLFHEQARPEILGIEQIIYHPHLDYTGRVDRRMRLNGRAMIMDIKTGGRQEYYWIKGAAYAIAYEREQGLPMLSVGQAILYLRPKAYTFNVCKTIMEESTYRKRWLAMVRKYQDEITS